MKDSTTNRVMEGLAALHALHVRLKMKHLLILIMLVTVGSPMYADEESKVAIQFFELLPVAADSTKEITDEELNLKGFVNVKPDLEIFRLKSAFGHTQKTYGGFPATEENVTSRTPSVLVELTEADAASFAMLTKRITGQRLLTKVGDKIWSAPRVMEEIDSGVIVIPCKSDADQKALLKLIAPLAPPIGEQGESPKP